MFVSGDRIGQSTNPNDFFLLEGSYIDLRLDFGQFLSEYVNNALIMLQTPFIVFVDYFLLINTLKSNFALKIFHSRYMFDINNIWKNIQ
jgi:hypothetical protein